MAFEIQTIPYSNFEIIELSDTELGTTIQISTHGGLLNSWTMPTKEGPSSYILSNVLANEFKEFEHDGFRSGKMSPFSCRLHQGEYQHRDQKYKIQKFYLGENAIHGILYDAPYKIISATT